MQTSKSENNFGAPDIETEEKLIEWSSCMPVIQKLNSINDFEEVNVLVVHLKKCLSFFIWKF